MGSSNSKNVSSAVVEAIQQTAVNVKGECETQSSQANVITNFQTCTDVDEINIEQSNVAVVEMDCLMDTLVKNDHQQELKAKLDQLSKAVTSGIPLGSANADNYAYTTVRGITEDMTNITNSCKANASQTNVLDGANFCAGKINITQDNDLDVVNKCVFKSVTENSSVTKADAEVKQVADSMLKGISGMELFMILIGVALVMVAAGWTLAKPLVGSVGAVFKGVGGIVEIIFKYFMPVLLLGVSVYLIVGYAKGTPALVPSRLRHSLGVSTLCPDAGVGEKKTFASFKAAEEAFMKDDAAAMMDYVEYDVDAGDATKSVKKAEPVIMFYGNTATCDPPPVPDPKDKTKFKDDLETIQRMQDSVTPTEKGPVNITVWKAVGHEPWMLWLGVALGAVGLLMGVVQISGMKKKKSVD